MKPANKYLVSVLATGFVVLLFLSVLLFWSRKLCQTIFFNKIALHTLIAGIRPSGLVPQLETDPCVKFPSLVLANVSDKDMPLLGLGIVRDFYNLEHNLTGKFAIRTEYSGPKGMGYILMLYDKSSGLFVFYDVFQQQRGWAKKPLLYAGPEGVSETADSNLGRFAPPQPRLWRNTGDTSIVFFDKSHKRFFKVDFENRSIIKGAELAGDSHPVHIEDRDPAVLGGAIGGLEKFQNTLFLQWSPPKREMTQQEFEEKYPLDNEYEQDRRKYYVPITKATIETRFKEDILVLNDNGQISRLDAKTLELSRPLGFLPQVKPGISTDLKNFFTYTALPVVVNDRYAGTITAALSREALELQVSVFDPNGRILKEQIAYANPYKAPGGLTPMTIDSTPRRFGANPYKAPSGLTLVVLTYLLESLQPALAQFASYFTAWSFDAVAGHSGLFFLPNSIVAIWGRENTTGLVGVGPMFGALLIISPSIILGLILALLICKNAAVVGLSRRARRNWFIGTLLFGLAAYITYRLTRPKETLVTCVNCGKMRRPDMEKCHRCNAPWFIPELVPPLWRVRDKTETRINTENL